MVADTETQFRDGAVVVVLRVQIVFSSESLVVFHARSSSPSLLYRGSLSQSILSLLPGLAVFLISFFLAFSTTDDSSEPPESARNKLSLITPPNALLAPKQPQSTVLAEGVAGADNDVIAVLLLQLMGVVGLPFAILMGATFYYCCCVAVVVSTYYGDKVFESMSRVLMLLSTPVRGFQSATESLEQEHRNQRCCCCCC